MCSNRPVALPELQEEDEEDSAMGQNRQSQFQVQIIVTPTQGCDGGAEIRVMGGTPRYSGRKLPPIHPYENTRNCAVESPSSHQSSNFIKNNHGLIQFENPKCCNHRNLCTQYGLTAPI